MENEFVEKPCPLCGARYLNTYTIFRVDISCDDYKYVCETEGCEYRSGYISYPENR